MTRAFAKSNRIGQVERLLLTSRVPLSQAEIARRCEVHRSTIGRLVQDMVDDGIPVRLTEDNLVYIERSAYLSRIHLKLHEATAVFLACRLLARYSDKPNQHTVVALEKLGAALQGAMPNIGLHIASTSADLARRFAKDVSEHQRVIERLTEAWAEGRKVRLWYRPLRARKAFQHTFAPYFLEPSAIGYGTYVIGLAEPPGKLRTRKLERIERVELTDEPFVVPAGFDPNALLAGAWGIWFEAEDQPTTVQLRFASGQASRRVQESHWHPSQRTELDEEGRLLWTAEIDEPQEMLPWIRGWGADCEVLAPAELREKVVGELRRQAQVYGVQPAKNPGVELYAHTPAPGSTVWHPLIDHLVGVAELARGFAEPFGAGELAYQLGLWHDVGKANPDFQAYLKRCYTDPSQKGTGPDHKAAGSALAAEHAPPLTLLVQGHHGGLRTQTDCQSWLAKRQDDREPDGTTSAVKGAISRVSALIPGLVPKGRPGVPPFLRDKYAAEFFLRMLFSALVDADFLDTETHWNPAKTALRGTTGGTEELLERFETSQTGLAAQANTPVNQARNALYQCCIAAAAQPPGLFRLAIPTGGGKTRSAMAFALRHALRHGQQRIIVAVPFISITEQTADVYRGIFQAGDDDMVVLEHHSGDTGRGEADDYNPGERRRRLAAENWDAPIIVTTTVQLFESMFANQTSRCRKLHRLARSVIILDEAQALPTHLLTPLLDGLRQLCTNYGTTVVLSTATQPAFESTAAFANLPAHEIVPDAARWFSALKRVRYDWRHQQPMAWGEVAELLRGEHQALAVVNTKQDALALLDALNDPEALHLSTLLCGAHRRAVIAAVRERLHDGRPCRLISTQVIEAGVDLDFPLVLRALGPLDRVIQAAGRCNREGRLVEGGRVIVFNPAEGGLPTGSYRTATDITSELLADAALDPDNPDDVRRYFRRLFSKVSLDSRAVQELRADRNYPEVAQRVRLIDEETMDVIITSHGSDAEQEFAQAAAAELREEHADTRRILRRLQPYLVAIRAQEARNYLGSGLIEELLPGLGIWHGAYDPVRGLVPDDDRSKLTAL
jgi:CRISPR-associated endonuclease/helicase Cas3